MLASHSTLTQKTGTVSDKRLRDKVFDYYRLIDQNKIDDVLDLFADDALYLRCEKTYQGHQQIAAFYKEERKISGQHKIQALWTFDHTVIVEGTFTGWGEEGQPKVIDFADFFTFNSVHKICERHTYLMLGSGYIRH